MNCVNLILKSDPPMVVAQKAICGEKILQVNVDSPEGCKTNLLKSFLEPETEMNNAVVHASDWDLCISAGY